MRGLMCRKKGSNPSAGLGSEGAAGEAARILRRGWRRPAPSSLGCVLQPPHPALLHGVLLITPGENVQRADPFLSAFPPGQPLADGMKNSRLGFLSLLKRVLPSTVPCSLSSKVGLVWVPGKNKKSAGLLRRGEHMGPGDCPELVRGAGNSSLASLAEDFSIARSGYLEDAGEYLSGVGVCIEKAPRSKVSRGPSPSTWVPMALATCLWSSAGAGMPLEPTLQEVVMWSERQLMLLWTLAGLWWSCGFCLRREAAGAPPWFVFTMPWLSDQL